MKDLNGLQVQQRLAGQPLERPFIFLAKRSTIEACTEAMKAGAIDFFRQPVDKYKLFDAIERAKERDTRTRRADAERKAIAALEQRLSPREREVLLHVVAGLQNRQIARALGITLKTVKVHRGHVMEKMRVSSVAELVRMTTKISLQPVELSNWLTQTVKVKQAKEARKDKRHRPGIMKSANSNFSELPKLPNGGKFCSSITQARNGYGPIIGLSSIRSTVHGRGGPRSS